MIEPIPCAGLKRIGVESPTVIGNRDAELVFDIAFAAQAAESQILTGG